MTESAGTVLMTADAVGGVWRYASTLGAGLVQRGWSVVVAGTGPAPSSARQADAAAAGIVLAWNCFALEWMQPTDAELAATGEWLLALERRYRPSLVHLNDYAHAALPWLAPSLVVAHSCVASWWRNVHEVAPPAAWDAYRRRVAHALAGPWPVVAPTAAFAGELAEIYGDIPGARIIFNGMSGGVGRSAVKLRRVVAVGRAWDEAKNLAVLDAAAACLDAPVFIAGERQGPDGQERRFAHAVGLGFVVDIPALLDDAAIFASPALYEPFGLSVLEAASAGCALVLSDIPTFHELWDGAARFVAPRDEAAWAAALRDLLADDGEVRRLGSAARRRAADYSAARMIDAYAELYAELTGTPTAREE